MSQPAKEVPPDFVAAVTRPELFEVPPRPRAEEEDPREASAPPPSPDPDTILVIGVALSSIAALAAMFVAISAPPWTPSPALPIAYAFAAIAIALALALALSGLRKGGWRRPIPSGLELVASACMTLGALMLFPLLGLWFWAFACYGPACGGATFSWVFAATISLALVAGIGGLVLQTTVDKVRRAFGATVSLMPFRSMGCALTALLAGATLVFLVGL